MQDEAKLMFEAWKTLDSARIAEAFRRAIAKIDARGPSRAVESVEEFLAALRDIGMPEDAQAALQADLGASRAYRRKSKISGTSA